MAQLVNHDLPLWLGCPSACDADAFRLRVALDCWDRRGSREDAEGGFRFRFCHYRILPKHCLKNLYRQSSGPYAKAPDCMELSVWSWVNQNGRDRILNILKPRESICGLHTSLLFSNSLQLLAFGVAA